MFEYLRSVDTVPAVAAILVVEVAGVWLDRAVILIRTIRTVWDSITMSRPTNYYSNLGIHYTSRPPLSHRPSSPRYRSSRHWRPGNQSEITFWLGDSLSTIIIENLSAKLVIKFE